MARLTSWIAAVLLAAAQSSSGLAGVWSLNRSQSEFPSDLGFTIAELTPTGVVGRLRESSEDAHRRQLLTEEARNPPARLTIADNLSAVTITNDRAQSRTLHPTNRQELIDLQDVKVGVTTARDGDHLIVTYHVEEDREIRYTYTPSGSPARLTVQTQFLDRSRNDKGDSVTRIYEPYSAVAAAPQSQQGPRAQTPAGPAPGENVGFDQRPGAEFRGLKNVGILVEELGPEATACGLKRDVLEDALAKRLSAGGLLVRKNSDEDTYVYVNIITTSLPNGTCATRYDAFLYTHATAKLAYRDQPVLVQVSLMHRGGIGTSGVASHSASVSRGLENYVDLFLTQIQTANK